MYDYLVVGAGLFGAVFANCAKSAGKSVLVVDRRSDVGGNLYTRPVEGIQVHVYGAHIFHTEDPQIWDYVQRFAEFRNYRHSPIANYRGEIYSLPFNMYTFNRMWGVTTPDEAMRRIEAQKREAGITEPRNLREQAIALVGKDIFEKLVKGYTEKQWGRDCRQLPPSIIRRLPVRFTYDNNYFQAAYQGIPSGGYTKMIRNMLNGIDVKTDTDYLLHRGELDPLARKVLFTGPIDAYFDYRYGCLEYRSVRFEQEMPDTANFQGSAVVNYTDRETPYTRIIEHKWFTQGLDEAGNALPRTVISREYSYEWRKGREPYYPLNDKRNQTLLKRYRDLASRTPNVLFGGRLGEYQYYDMDKTIASALKLWCEQESRP